MFRPLAHRVSRWLAFGVVLLAAATIREDTPSAINQAIIWLPTGVAMAGLCLLGLRAWWVVALTTIVQRFLLGYDLSVAMPAAAGSTAEAVLGVLVLRRFGFRASLERLRDVGALLAAAAIAPLGSIFFSWIGRTFVWVDPNMPFYSGWDGWWRMNALGVLTVVPFALTWLTIPRREITPALALVVGVASIGIPMLLVATMIAVPPGITGVMWLNLVLAPIAFYAAGRFGVRGATLAGTLAALVVALATSRGYGPFLELPRDQRHVALQLFELTFVAIPPAFGAVVSERRTAQALGARSEDLLASINRNVKEGLFRASADLHVLYANLAFARMFGHESPEQALGRGVTDAFAEPMRMAELLRRVEEHGQWLNEEVELRRLDGTTFWALLSGTAVRGADGAISHYDGALADITARKELEEQFRQSQKMEAVGKLAGGVAHDFNNLLTVIFGYADAIRTESVDAPHLGGYADQVLDAAKRASGLTRQLLAYSRQQMLSPKVLELSVVVDQMSGMLRRLIGEDIRLVVEHRSGACWVRVDPSQIEQVLLNLAVNARDAMPGGGTLVIATSLADGAEVRAHERTDLAPGPSVMLCVRDTGSGMAPEVQARAFDPFFTTKEMGKGTGLGLSTVYGIVKQSGGAVWLESAPGAGTTAWIALPRWAAPGAAEEAPAPVVHGPSGGTVLVVEDEPGVRALVSRTLAGAGFHVLEASDGESALEAARRHAGAIDLVLTDVVMPRMSGREMAAKLMTSRPGLRFLFVSGYPDDARAPQELAGSAGTFLAKPFTPDQLLDRVCTLLGPAAVRG